MGQAMEWMEHKSLLINNFLIKDDKTGEINYQVTAIAYLIPISLVLGITLYEFYGKKSVPVQANQKKNKKNKRD